MKNLSKRIATIAATLALVVVLGVTLAACGGSGSSVGDYAERLVNYGYSVNITTSFGYQTDEDGVTYLLIEGEPAFEVPEMGVIKWGIQAYNSGSYADIMIAELETKDAAEAVAASIEAAFAKQLEAAEAEYAEGKAQYETTLANLQEQLDQQTDEGEKATIQSQIDYLNSMYESETKYIEAARANKVERSGKVVFAGHSDAIKIAR